MQFPEILIEHCHPDVEQVNCSIINAQMFSHHYSLKNVRSEERRVGKECLE